MLRVSNLCFIQLFHKICNWLQLFFDQKSHERVTPLGNNCGIFLGNDCGTLLSNEGVTFLSNDCGELLGNKRGTFLSND